MQLKNKRILLTGAAGFIGNEMTRQILLKGPAEFITIDKMSYMSNDKFHNENSIPVHKIDIASKEAFDIVTEFKPDILINMAANSHVDNSIKDPDSFLESNVRGTTNLMNACLKMESLPLFLFISTDEIYGDKLIGESKEYDSRMASSPYSASKASAELFVESYGRTFKLPYLITRSSNNYGPHQHYEKLIPKVIQNIMDGKKIPVYTPGNQERQWIHVTDNCEGIISAIEFYKESDVFNIGGDRVTVNLNIIKAICKLMSVDPKQYIEYVGDRPGHDTRYCISCDKIFKHTGWKPKISLNNGLMSTIEWYALN
jgi:dTDP-glucose 4,6-dehydratase